MIFNDTLYVDLELELQPDIEFELEEIPDIELELETAYVVYGISGEEYTGAYIVDPAFDEITLDTTDKLLRDDVTVNPIYVSRVENLSGGTTVYIGGNFNA